MYLLDNGNIFFLLNGCHYSHSKYVRIENTSSSRRAGYATDFVFSHGLLTTL